MTALAAIPVAALLVAAATACTTGPADFLTEAKKGNGCIEFWFNRYQSAWSALLGTAGTLTAAGIAWIAVQRQIGEASSQNVMSRWHAAFAIRDAMVRDRDLTRRGHGSLTAIAENLAEIGITPWLPTVLDHIGELQATADGNLAEVNAAGTPWTVETTDVRERILLKLAALSIKCTQLNGELRRHTAESLERKHTVPKSEALLQLGREANALRKDVDTIRTEYLTRTSLEVVEIGRLCEHLRHQVFKADRPLAHRSDLTGKPKRFG